MLNDSSISVERLHSFVKTIYFDAILALNQNLWSPIGIDLQQKLLLRSRGTSSACVFDDIFDFARVFENQGHAENSNYMTSSSSSETLDSMFAVSAM